jgi:hypothetical protein
MLYNTLKLHLPALVPSWRFFDVIAPSPRIEYACLENERDAPGAWHEFNPRPARLSFGAMLARLFWNPRWNESLFLATCAERLLESPSDFRRDEILRRIARALERDRADARPFLQFRLVLLSRDGAHIQRQIAYVSPPCRRAGKALS